MAAKSLKFLSKTVVLTTWPRLLPPASRMALRFSRTRVVCSLIPPATACPVLGSRAIWPAVKMRFPARTPCAYGPIAAGAPSVLILERLMFRFYDDGGLGRREAMAIENHPRDEFAKTFLTRRQPSNAQGQFHEEI